MRFAANLGLHVEFVDAFFISPKTIAVLSSIACRHILHWYLCPLWGTQLGTEGRRFRRTIIILQHLQRPCDLTADGELTGISHDSHLFEDWIMDQPAYHLPHELQVVLVRIQPTSHLKVPLPHIVTHKGQGAPLAKALHGQQGHGYTVVRPATTDSQYSGTGLCWPHHIERIERSDEHSSELQS